MTPALTPTDTVARALIETAVARLEADGVQRGYALVRLRAAVGLLQHEEMALEAREMGRRVAWEVQPAERNVSV